jgi:hypothetical protein
MDQREDEFKAEKRKKDEKNNLYESLNEEERGGIAFKALGIELV